MYAIRAKRSGRNMRYCSTQCSGPMQAFFIGCVCVIPIVYCENEFGLIH